ncbi:hypothetical protein ACHAWF_008909, partial [Thalassiosira exigua]
AGSGPSVDVVHAPLPPPGQGPGGAQAQGQGAASPSAAAGGGGATGPSATVPPSSAASTSGVSSTGLSSSAAASTSTAASGGDETKKDDASPSDPSEEATVLAYLRRHGLVDAASRLKEILEKEREEGGGEAGEKRKRDDGTKDAGKEGDEEEGGDKKFPPIDYDVDEGGMDLDDDNAASAGGSSSGGGGGGSGGGGDSSKPILPAATGGGLGYDLDAAPTVALWGAGSAPPALRNREVARTLLEGRSLDRELDADEKGASKEGKKAGGKGDGKERELDEQEALLNFRDEARRYVEGFTSLVTWILALSDDPANPLPGPSSAGGHSAMGEDKVTGKSTEKGKDEDGDKMDVDDDGSAKDKPHEGLSTLVGHSLAAARHGSCKTPTVSLPLGANASIPTAQALAREHPTCLPPSSKPELLSLSFPLLVHTYCELLTCGLEHTARALLDAYRHLYEPIHRNELADLDKCNSLAAVAELNDDVIRQSVAHSESRALGAQAKLIERKISELEGQLRRVEGKNRPNAEERKAKEDLGRRLGKYKDASAKHRRKLAELAARNDALGAKLSALPFLRRARALKWNITISTSSFAALAGFVRSRDELLPMSALLQSRCHLIVERRDPLPFCPPAVLEDEHKGGANKDDEKRGQGKVRWAAPLHPEARAAEAGAALPPGPAGPASARSLLAKGSEELPFPQLKLAEGADEDARERAAVEFNRALLVNGFRRLEAIERKREYEAGLAGGRGGAVRIADPLAPSILLATIGSSRGGDNEADVGAGPAASVRREPDVGVVSASICLPDGRRGAAGCDDAAVRIWNLDRRTPGDSSASREDGASLGQPSAVLLGHKNGFPVFDVDWTRDGRTLLSAGGDGTVRLWDVQAVGPYGKLSNVRQQKNSNSSSNTVGGPASSSLSTVSVPGAKAESMVEVSGAALAVYRGHAPSTPIWGVASAPCGYYFASAGADYTARIWTTDRTTPVRVLAGHSSPSVNGVAWHPNCNYVLTAGDDKTCRMFDVQTGKCVRLLSGSSRGMNMVRVSPSGRYAAGAGHDGVVRIWDLGNGRMADELRPPPAGGGVAGSGFSGGMITSMSYSACGTALAVAGEDGAVRVWDVRGAGDHMSNPKFFAATQGGSAISSSSSTSLLGGAPGSEQLRPGMKVPAKAFSTNDVAVMDLKFTKRNLLLALGNH